MTDDKYMLPNLTVHSLDYLLDFYSKLYYNYGSIYDIDISFSRS